MSALAAKTGFAVASFDIDRGHIPKPKRKNQKKYKFAKRNTMDINGEVGMASLHLCFQHFFVGTYWGHQAICTTDRSS